MLKKLKSRLGGSIKRLLATPANGSLAGDHTPAPPSTRRVQDPAARLRRQKRLQLRLMRRDLFRLMEQHADSRRLMRHLAIVERTLRKDGLAAVEALPRAVIDKALVQLETLVQDWSPEGLADVRSRLAVMLRDRPLSAVAGLPGLHVIEEDEDDEMAQLGRGLIVTVDLEHVSDTDHAAFAEMERSWAGRMPQSPAADPVA